MKSKLKVIMVLVLLPLFFNAAAVHASEVTDILKATIDGAFKVLNDPSLKGPEKEALKREKLRAAIKKTLDFAEMSKRSLARHWLKRTDAERKEFVALFSDLLENSYMDKIEMNSDAKVRYYGERKAGNKVEVKTNVLTRKGLVVPINYRLMKKGGVWVVYDIVIEGVSLVSNYRTQFNKIIRQSSYEDLVKGLKEKAVNRSASNDKPGP
ncbi:MAG: ABC transporter substrate-binding protein [Thermodesulfobacteriota bacterium]